MPLELVRNDITKMKVDAIVNAANRTLLGGGGVDGAIHRAAGKKLLGECKALGGCETGDAKLTQGYDLFAKYVIHTVGPVWQGGNMGEEMLLRSCYRKSLEIAKNQKLSSVAFPLISAGAYGYPKDMALRIAIDEIGSFLMENEMMVYIVIFDKEALHTGKKIFSAVSEYIDDNYVEDRISIQEERRRQVFSRCRPTPPVSQNIGQLSVEHSTANDGAAKGNSLFAMLTELDESFSEMLIRKIDEKGMTDVECYKKANIDRKLFSKIRSDKGYRPKKTTAIAFAIALELTLDETEDMLKKAGFALSHSSKFDIIIEYFIKNEKYNIHEINETLFAFDQVLLGV